MRAVSGCAVNLSDMTVGVVHVGVSEPPTAISRAFRAINANVQSRHVFVMQGEFIIVSDKDLAAPKPAHIQV